MCICTCSIVFENKYCRLALWGSAAHPPIPPPTFKTPSRLLRPWIKKQIFQIKRKTGPKLEIVNVTNFFYPMDGFIFMWPGIFF